MSTSYPLQRTSLLVPITALAFLSSSMPTLLVAEDNLLKAYDTSTHPLRLTLRVFHAQTIHGIVISGDLILLWGNQSVTALPTPALEAALTGGGEPPAPLAEAKAHDWLFSAAVSPAGRIAFIVVWTCELPAAGPPSCEVLSVFAGHEGSIFGVDISPEFEGAGGPPGERMRLLASCSDDRTIRLWDVSKASLERGVVRASFGEARETGFGSVDLSAVADASSAPVAVAMGHGSRIWHVKFAGHGLGFDKGQVVMPVYSFGEDATVHKWRLEVDVAAWQARRASAEAGDGGAGKLILRETFAHHDGKHIWAAAVEPLKQGGSLIATGGADARVNLITDDVDTTASGEGSNGLDTLPSELSQLVFEDILRRLPPSNQEYPPPSRKRPEGFQNFVFISQNTLLAASTRGRILLGTFGADLSWEEISYEGQHGRDLAFCTTIRSPAPGVAILGTATKKLFLYKDSTVKEITIMNGKISDIFVVKPLSDDSPLVAELLVMMIGGPDVMQLLTVDISSVTVTSSLSVPGQQASYVATAAHLVGDVLIIGSRHGHISLFQRSPTELTLQSPIVRHTVDTITSIISLPTSLNGETHLLITARDAHYRLYALLSSPKPHLTLLHQTHVPSLTTIESAHFSPDHDLLLTGFRSRLFPLYNETPRRDIHTHDVGGPNRIWSAPAPASSPLRIAYARAGILLLKTQHHPPHEVLKSGTHGREIRAGLRWLADRGDGALLFSCGGNEEFVAVWADKSPDGDLRILDFDITAGEGGVVVSMVFSNSTVGTYLYDGGQFTLLAKGRYTGACLTRVRHLRVDGAELEIGTAATDGHLGVWIAQRGEPGAAGEYALQTTARLHQSSVKALDMSTLDHDGAEMRLLLTGGDDNGLGITVLQRRAGEYEFVSKTGVKGAHAAAINGLAILQTAPLSAEKQARRTTFATVSNDQRVKVWSLRWGLTEHDEAQLTLLANENSGVADPGDLDVLDGAEEEDFREIVVVGVGMETWRFDLAGKGTLRRS
ncbi:RNA polymerase II holoenzyme cyclin-like subunit [Verticillium dahliae VDG2]|nr:RNA polymerase II holoenzyme cyclin-like subunit [Verticillium dahliae VDG2]